MASGKTIEFAKNILSYMASGSNLPAHNSVDGGLYVALLSGTPANPETGGPFAGSDLAAKEVSAGNGFRAFLSNDTLNTTGLDSINDAVTVVNDGVEVTFDLAPSNFNVSGYALCYHPTSTDSSGYLAYEFFVGANVSKQREVNQGDTIKINSNGLTIREK